MNRSNFFAELKRRNIYKVAVAYAVIAWLFEMISARTRDLDTTILQLKLVAVTHGAAD